MKEPKYFTSVKYNLLYIAVLVVCCLTGHAQTEQVDAKIRQTFSQYKSGYIQEKLFVHTDKSSYVSREICWFRIYCVDAFYNKPGTISKIAYVELLDKNNVPVLQQKVSLKPGESNGSFLIPVNIPTGNYRFRAYTSWMKNFSPDYYFEKPVRIINPQNLANDSTTAKNKKIDCQFFPEGGNLVQNIQSKIAFRITDAYGSGLNCQGTLVNTKGDTIIKFRPLSLGLGNFVFTPLTGESYKAIIRLTDGAELTKALPSAYEQGYVLSVQEKDKESLIVHISASSSFNGQSAYLFVHGSHSSLPVINVQLNNNQSQVEVKKTDLEGGISIFSLFNREGEPVCERLYFKYPDEELLIDGETDNDYATRKKIDLKISATDQTGKPMPANISLAVFRIDSLQTPDDLNIRNYLYLSSELGFVENPAYYFNAQNENRQAAVDNLMLTHGWRRFKWTDLKTGTARKFEFAPEYYGHIIRGKIVNNLTGAPVKNITAYLSAPSTRTEFRVTNSDSSGRVRFELPGFYGTQEIVVQTDPREDSLAHVDLLSPFSDKYAETTLTAFPLPAKYTPVLMGQSVSEQVNHIYRANRLSQFTLQPVDTSTFYMNPDEKYFLDNYVRFQTMEEVIREYVVSSNVSLKKDRFKLYLAAKGQYQFFSDEPLILIDGVPFFETNELFKQDPFKIRRLDLVNREYALGYKTFFGIINLTTYRGDLNGIQMDPRAIVLDYPGIPEQREFFSPAYETESQISSRMPDYRTLLYWSPEIKSGAETKTSIPFYTSDLPGKYAVVMMGITASGIPGASIQYFTVKK